MNYQDEIIMKLQNDGFNHLHFEDLQRLARLIEIETIPLKSKLFVVQQNCRKLKTMFKHIDTHLPENWLKEKWYLDGKDAFENIADEKEKRSKGRSKQ